MISLMLPTIRKLVCSLFISFLAAANLSMTWPDPRDILTESDYEVEEELWDHPAVHTVDDKVQSFLRWYCFSSKELSKLRCLNKEGNEPTKDPESDSGYDGDSYDAVAIFDSQERKLEFEIGYRLDAEDCFEKSAQLSNLLAGEDSVCLYAAQWPPQEAWGTDLDGKPLDYFISYGFKTRRGRYLAPVFDPDSDDYIGGE